MINKYILYIYGLLGVFAILMGPKLIRVMTYSKTKGQVFGFEERLVQGKYNSYVKRYPRVTYKVGQQKFTILAPSDMEEASWKMDSVIVYYDNTHPNAGIIYNFYGVWGDPLNFLLPFFLIWTICIFSKDFIPKTINIKKLLSNINWK